ncbi:MAG: phosphatase PAP2 family protein [Bacteroidales bacterium]|jgi:undecaprenyl-diphosphatase|nr:phosphatase PAP2 family protein [Bacteroidales bacterium]
MIEYLENIDRQIFMFLNGLHADWLDPIMKQITSFWFWYPIAALFLVLTIVYYKKNFWIPLVFTILCFTFTDQGSNITKKNVKRYRPTHNIEIGESVHVVDDYRGGQYGFFSGHAANGFGLAFITLLFIRKRYYTWIVLIWAVLVSYSRIYMGVHYPSDILVGAIFGTAMAFLIYKLCNSIPFFARKLNVIK